MSTTTSAYMVASLLEKMSNEDSDIRYMATADLITELQKDSFNLEDSTEKKVIDAVLTLMKDKSGEVQNLAVKCLGPLVKKIKEAQLQDVVDKLCNFAAQQEVEELRDIASIGLKTIIVEIPVNSPIGNNVTKRVLPRLITLISNNKATYEVQMDTLDILAEISARFGSSVSQDMNKQQQNALLPLLGYPRPAVRKRTTVAIGNLVMHTNDELFDELVKRLLVELNKSADSKEMLRTLIQCVGALSRFSAPRLGAYLSQILPLVIKYTKTDDDDELRENCLQALESFVLRCPTEMTPYITQIVQLSLEYLKYDPNYADDEEEEEGDEGENEAMEQDNDEEDEDEDADDYSDDDDISWKVRRSASKTLSAIIGTRGELLSQLYHQVAPALIGRFKEREESVRVDVLQTFIVLLRQTLVTAIDFTHNVDMEMGGENSKRRRGTGSPSVVPMETEESPKQLLRNQVPRLSRALSKQLVSKSTQTRQTGFTLLRELVTVLNGGLENHIGLFIPAIESSLSSAAADQHHIGTTSNLKIETLTFLRQLFKTHPAVAFHKYLRRLCPPIISSVQDKFYKITAEAFLVCIELIKVIRPINYDSVSQTQTVQPLNPEFKPYIAQIYTVTMQRLATSDADQEVKERSIMCLGALLSQAGDQLVAEHRAAFNILLERLRNEITRLTTVKTLTAIANSPVCTGEEVKRTVLEAVDDVAVLLRKSNRQLKVASLGCLEVLVKRYGKFLTPASFTNLLTELKPLISDADLHLLPLSLTTVVSILHANPGSIPIIKQDVLPSVFRLVQSPLVQGAALDSLLTLFAALVRTNPQDYTLLVAGLIGPVANDKQVQLAVSKQSYSTIAQCVATLCLNSEANCSSTVSDFERQIEDTNSSESVKYLSLLTLGEIGRKVDLSGHAKVHTTILVLFSVPSEEVKSAAAFALGNISVGNIPKYLPIIISEIKQQPKRRYLLLHALKELITRHSQKEGSNSLGTYSDEIWVLLFDKCESDEEGTRNVVAECLGKLTLTNPYKFLPELQKRLQSSSPQTRGTVVTAIKYTFTDQAQNYDDLLRPLIVEFLSLMKDTDLNVRRLSLSTLNSAAHNKPYLIRDVLNTLLPLLYQETVVKEELIRMVEMGPFKHKVDDGLEIRKSAFECMYTLLDSCLDKIEIFGFMDRVFAGLSDQHDIKVLAHLMMMRLANVAPTAVTQKLDDAVEPLKATLNYKVKQTAVKQEVEKNQELVRSALRCIAVLTKLSEPATTPRFDTFLKEIRASTLGDEYKTIVADADNKERRGADYMDLS
ncbi:hypothetical protein BC938DRAFT_473352 [Jimgerdemannia flammicorona]|uniref:TATA-binding protein interacting (TIP20) domain-containing protein n=1 Tax=Jimgerdemannia flammicorona TaxID=994334 RepID=A0A433QTD0_9FUNG|nr:hypothetical protein BC938DRAFT_473352 [Jimgerdemannia flammicorona]